MSFAPDASSCRCIWRFELYISANSVPEEKKVPLFLTVIGGTVYSSLHDLFAPESPVDKPYATIVEKLKAHFEPRPGTSLPTDIPSIRGTKVLMNPLPNTWRSFAA